MTKLSYADLEFPNYINTNIAASIVGKKGRTKKKINLSVPEIVNAAELSGSNMLIISDTGKGKTRLAADIGWYHFGGDGEEGKTAWVKGRLDFEPRDFFLRTRIDREERLYDSRTATQIDIKRIQRLLFILDELNRIPLLKQNAAMDIAEGEYAHNGVSYALGRGGYALFLGTANVNKINGEFKGTSSIDKALLSRAHLVIDLDHLPFRPTPSDIEEMHEREADPRVRKGEPRDISDKIIEEFHAIREKSKIIDPYILAFDYMVGDYGLGFCNKDTLREKTTTFPSLCGDCTYSGKKMCSMAKASPPRTLQAIRSLALGLERVITLREGADIELDPFDLVLLAYQFTAHHGNLNEIMAQTEFGGRTQALMDTVKVELGKRIELFRKYMPLIIEGKDPVVIRYTIDGMEQTVERNTTTPDLLKQANIPYTVVDLRSELKMEGIGTEWVDTFTKRYKK